MSVQGGKPQPIYVVTQAELDSGAFRLQPGPATKVVGLQGATRGVLAGPSQPVFVVSGSYERGIEGGVAIPVSNMTSTTRPVEHGLAIPVYVVEDDGQFAPVVPALDLTAPSDLSALAISDTEIDLSWTDTAPDATGYKIERSPAGAGTWAEIDDIAAPATSYSDTGLTPVTGYDYRIRAYAGAENGAYSNTATETTEATPYAGPFNGITFAALYGLKRYLTSYTGNLIRLRRSNDNAESNFGYVEATGLLDTAAIATWLGANNAFVVTWYDQSGNGRNATQTTAANQSAYVASAVNSLPGLHVNTTDGWVTASMPHFPSKRGSLVAAINHLIADSSGAIAGTFTQSTPDWLFYSPTANIEAKYAFYDGALWYTAAFDSTNVTFIKSIVQVSDTARVLRRNGGSGESLGATNAQLANNPLYIGQYSVNAPLMGYMFALAYVHSALSAADHNTIGNELATLYGLTWTTVS